MNAPLIETRGLAHRYGETEALTGVDLTVAEGRTVALLGANGSGKTTLLLHLNGILRPTAGEVRFQGSPLSYRRGELRRLRQQVGLVFQDPDDQLFAATVLDDVAFAPRNQGLDDRTATEQARQVLAALGAADLAERPIHALSHGEKQRVAVAGVLAMEPRLMVLDEPTAGLDPQGRDRFLQCVEGVRACGTTLLVATHDMELAYRLADEVAVLGDGGLLAQGAPRDVLADARLLARAGLEGPWVLEVARRLQQAGLVETEPDAVRDRRALFALLDTLGGED